MNKPLQSLALVLLGVILTTTVGNIREENSCFTVMSNSIESWTNNEMRDERIRNYCKHGSPIYPSR